MPFFEPGGGGSGAALKYRVPQDVFVGATRNAAETARNNALKAADLAEFDADPNLLIILRVGAVDISQARRNGAWRDIANVARGQRGLPGPESMLTDAEIKQKYEANADTEAYTTAEKTQVAKLTDDRIALIDSVASPVRTVGLIQWDLNPAIIEGRAASDFETTFRAQFDFPYLPLTDYYFEVWAVDPNGAGQILHDRAQWARVTHLDISIDAIEAENIADTILAAHDHLEIEFRFYADSVTIVPVAVTSRRVLIVEDDGSGSGSNDAVARKAAADAAVLARAALGNADGNAIQIGKNRIAIGENKEAIDAIPVYAADMEVWPPNVAKHTDFQRNFQSTLSALSPTLATEGGATGTRFTNNFQILTRLSDGTVVQLHTQGWAFTEDNRQTIPWAVSAAEFNAVGASAATNGIEIWGEFRAIYGGGVNELRGRTSPFFIDFGEEDEWPATRGDLKGIGGGLTQAQQIALLSLVAQPGVFRFVNSDDLAEKLKSIRISVANPELLTGDVWVEGWTQGQPGTGARAKWASNIASQTITLSDANADAVATALIANEDDEVEVRLRFYDKESGGGEIERIGLNLPIVQVREPFAMSANAAAAVNLVTNVWTTVATLTIPAARLNGGPVVLMFNGTGNRASGSGDVDIRIRRGDAVLRTVNDEIELSGQNEHGQVAEFLRDTPPVGADAVYTVQVRSNGNLAGNMTAREFMSIGGLVA